MSRSDATLFWSFGIAPVQQWIAQSRRSRDLRVGSAFLSWVMAKALAKLEAAGDVVVVPKPTSGSFATIAGLAFAEVLDHVDYSIPNRASGYTSHEDIDALEARLSASSAVAAAAWEEIRCASSTRDPFPNRHGGGAWTQLGPELAPPQESPIQILWCAKRIARGAVEDGLKAIDLLYLSLKRSRPMLHCTGRPVGKCVQCGRREALGGTAWSRWRLFHDHLETLPEIRIGYRFDPGERLCPTCATRRLAGYLSHQPFPSTSTIAAAEWLERVAKIRDLATLLAAAREGARRAGANVNDDDLGPYFYRRTLERTVNALAEDDWDRERARSLHQQLESLDRLSAEIRSLRQAGRLGIAPEPSHYLAVVMFDGDDMGRWVQASPENVSGAIAGFAQELSGVIELHRGRAFYLGGDEGLVLCPIEQVLAFAASVQELWTRHLASSRALGAGPERTAPTLSMGVAIFDRERPLGAAIRIARSALELAKSQVSKNSLAVTVQTASGNVFSAVDTWGEGWARTRRAVDLVADGRLSTGWAYDVEELIQPLPLSAWQNEGARAALRAEVKRLTKRRVTSATSDSDDSRARLAERLWTEDLRGETLWETQPDGAAVATLASQLHLIAFLARQSAGSVGTSAEAT